MNGLTLEARRLAALTVLAAAWAAGACSSPANPSPMATGGVMNSGTGGALGTTGGNNPVGTGGVVTATTGGMSVGTTGGSLSGATGGTVGNGGTPTSSSGGTVGNGGTPGASTGGTSAGGATTQSGGGPSTATGGSGGAVAKVKMCATKTALTVPLITNFDSYDGKVEANKWATPFNGKTGADADAPYAGLYSYDDKTGTPFLGMVGGANSSTYAGSVSNPMATAWGGALGIWMACVNASTYQGVSFYARGTIPTGKIGVGLTMESTSIPDATDPAAGGTCDAGAMCKSPLAEVPVTPDWTLVKIPWSMFAAGVGSAMVAVTPTGDGIAGFTFAVGLNFVESAPGSMTYVATPAMYDLQVDDVGFY